MVRHTAAKRRRAVPSGDVASHAVGRVQGVVVADVAGGTGRRSGRRVRPHQRKSSCGVVEGCCTPGNCVVAGSAVGNAERGSCRCVIGIRRLLPSGQMTTGVAAVRGRNRQAVVVVDVA